MLMKIGIAVLAEHTDPPIIFIRTNQNGMGYVDSVLVV